MLATEPEFVAHRILHCAAVGVCVVLLQTFCLQDMTLRPVAELAEELGHRRSKGRGEGTNDIEIRCGQGVLPNHDLEGGKLGGRMASGVVREL